MKFTYCPDCGAKLVEIHAGDDGMVPYCSTCEKAWFELFPSCIIVLIYNDLGEIALSKQVFPSRPYYSLTSGYITPGETAEECAIREAKEELGLDLESLEYAGTYWYAKKSMLMHGFLGCAKKKDLVLSEEIETACWVPADKAPSIMFPDHPGNTAAALYRLYRARHPM